MLAIGSAGADLDAVAYGSNWHVCRAAFDGRPVVLVFHGRDNQDVGRGVVQTIRNVYRSCDELFVVNVVDLGMYPRVMRRLAEHDMQIAWQREVDDLPRDLDPERHIVIVPDWSGAICRVWDAPEPPLTVSAALIDSSWRVRHTHVGVGAEDAMLASISLL